MPISDDTKVVELMKLLPENHFLKVGLYNERVYVVVCTQDEEGRLVTVYGDDGPTFLAALRGVLFRLGKIS